MQNSSLSKHDDHRIIKVLPNNDKEPSKHAGSRSEIEATHIAIPLFVLFLICVVIFVLKLKYRKQKIKVYSYENQQLLIPDENCRNLRFKNLIGKGSFGVVWKAILDDDANVAVKLCSSEKYEKWLKEKNIFDEDLNHKNIIKFLGSEIRKMKEETALLLIFEYLDKGDLRTYLMEKTLDVEKLLFFICSFYNGLAFLHSWNDSSGNYKNAIAHRDIKSSNLLISNQRGCVIADFGLAVSLNHPAVFTWFDNKLQVGTARYMAPEKLTGIVGCNDPALALCQMDVYAAAIVSYEMTSRCEFAKDGLETSFYTPKEFTLPFWDMVGPHPTNDEMKEIIVHKKIRPNVEPEWKSNKFIDKIANLMNECWNESANERPTAKEMFNEIKELFLNFELQSTYSNNQSKNEPSAEIQPNRCVVQINYHNDHRNKHLE